MAEFCRMLVAGIIAAILAPYFSYFFDFKKENRQITLRNLGETYELTKQFKNYISQTPLNIMFLIALQKNMINKDSFPKLIESPVNRLLTLLDYHLSAPESLINRIEIQYNEILESVRPITEAINKPNKDEYFASAIAKGIAAAGNDLGLTKEIIVWIKTRKQTIESELSIFQSLLARLWRNRPSVLAKILAPKIAP
jgi:hypothetical protein